MDKSVEKPVLSEIVAKKPRSAVYAKKQKEFTGKPSSLNRNQVVDVRNEPRLHVKIENSESFKGKGALKEVPLNNAFGVGIKRRRNGSNALRVKPNVPESKPNKEEEGLSTHTELLVPKEEENSCLGDGTPEKGNDGDFQKGDSNSNSSSGATSSSHLLGQKRKEIEEEDLEENAALMLCSLSDQRTALNGVHVLSGVQVSNESVGRGRIVRRRRSSEGFVRRRRHFYEVNLRDFNPFCIVKWRIRVYWPLDRSWYIGSVKEYDPVIRKHRVRYDDQEEEWLDLNYERFKLLLYPSDVPNKDPNLVLRENLEEEEREEDSEATIDSSEEESSEPVKPLVACSSSYQSKPIQIPVTSNNNNNFEIKANNSSSTDGRFLFVYSRRRFRNRKEKNLSSVSISEQMPIRRDIMLKLNVPLKLFAGPVLIGSDFLNWHSSFLLYHGALITVSPVIRLEITVSDDSYGSGYFLFKICLRSAISLLCFLVRMFEKANKCNVEENKVPVTSISYTISGLRGYKGRVILGLFSFFQISNLRWDYFQKRIKCIKMEDSSRGLVDRLLLYQPTFSGVNPMIFFMNEKTTLNPPPSFLLGSHHETIPVSNSSQNPEPTTLVYVSGDNNNNIDEKNATIVEVPLDQISHVVALPAPVQRTNELFHSSTPTAPRSTPHRARASSLLKLWPVEPVLKAQSNNQKMPPQSSSNKSSTLSCYANVLVTANSRGWRDCGAHVVIDLDEQEGARLCVQVFGETKYFYRANQVMQPGSTNRYTHAMMWRGGRDWSLEFTDRNQWFVFKQMYQECYNRNMRAASVKNIPTPGVRMVQTEKNMVGGFRESFVRGPRYIRQIASDIDAALDPSRVLYDMDSEDEEWVLGFEEGELTEDLFERVMDKCEKLAYMNKCTEFDVEQIEELMRDVGPAEVVKEVASYWSTKRKKKDMPLIRQLQPPLWMHYQKQVEEWEASARKILRAPHSAHSRAPPAEKPPMFAFCLRPRGLKLRHHRPQKKLLLSSRTHLGSHKSGRRHGASTSRERVASISRLSFPNRRGISDNRQTEPPSLSQQTLLTGKRVHPASSSDMSSERTNPNPTRLPSENNLWFLKEDVEEFKLRDASNAALHAATMAKLKREKAQLLMQKADVAMYKARVALMISDAIKSSEGTTTGGGAS